MLAIAINILSTTNKVMKLKWLMVVLIIQM